MMSDALRRSLSRRSLFFDSAQNDSSRAQGDIRYSDELCLSWLNKVYNNK